MKQGFYFKIPNPFYHITNWFRKLISKERCLHENWVMDKQITMIECLECGKQAWCKETKDLFSSEPIEKKVEVACDWHGHNLSILKWGQCPKCKATKLDKSFIKKNDE
jgi:uncharacterized CHY-type Zn-finger protein